MAVEPLIEWKVKIRAPKNIARLDPYDRGFMVWLGMRLTRKFRKRAYAGRTAEGRSFPPYSKAYKKIKEKAGKYRGHVDLSFTSQMLRSMAPIITKKKRLRIGFSDTHQTARASQRDTKTARKTRAMLEAKMAAGEPLTKGQKFWMKLDKQGKRTVTNQHIANALAARKGSGQWINNVTGKPPYGFTNTNQKENRWIEQQYNQRVILRKAAKLPPAISIKDIPQDIRNFVKILRPK